MTDKDDLFLPPSEEELNLYAAPTQEELDEFAPEKTVDTSKSSLQPAPLPQLKPENEVIDSKKIEQEEKLLDAQWEEISKDSPFKALSPEKFKEIQRIAQEKGNLEIAKEAAKEGFTFGYKSELGAIGSDKDYDQARLEDELLLKLMAEKSPRLFMGSEIGGNIVNPISWIPATKLISTIGKLAKFYPAIKTAIKTGNVKSLLPAVAKEAGKMGGPASLLSTVAKEAGKMGAYGAGMGALYGSGKSLEEAGSPEFLKETLMSGATTGVVSGAFGALSPFKAAAPITLGALAGGVGAPLLTGESDSALPGAALLATVGGLVPAIPIATRALNAVTNSGKWNKLMDVVREGHDVTSDEFYSKMYNKVASKNTAEAAEFVKDFEDNIFKTSAEDITNYFMDEAKKIANVTQETEKEFAQFTNQVAKEIYENIAVKLKKAAEEKKVVDPSDLAKTFTDVFKTASERYSGKSGVSELAAKDLADEMSRQFTQEMPQELSLKINATLDEGKLARFKLYGNVPEEQLSEFQKIVQKEASTDPNIAKQQLGEVQQKIESEGFVPVGEPKIQKEITPEKEVEEIVEQLFNPKKYDILTKEQGGKTILTQKTAAGKAPTEELQERFNIPEKEVREPFIAEGGKKPQPPFTVLTERQLTTPKKEMDKVTLEFKKVIEGKPLNEMDPIELNEARKKLNEVYRRRMLTSSGEKRSDIDAGLFEDYRNFIKQLDELEENAIADIDPVTKQKIPSEVSTLRKDWGKLKDIFSQELKLDAGTIAKLDRGELVELSDLHRTIKSAINQSATEPDYNAYVRVLEFLQKYKPEKARELSTKLEDVITTAKKLKPYTEDESLKVNSVLNKIDALRKRSLTKEIPPSISNAENVIREYQALQEIIGGFDPKVSTASTKIPEESVTRFVSNLGDPEFLQQERTKQALDIVKKYKPELSEKMQNEFSKESELLDILNDFRKKTTFGGDFVRPDTMAAGTKVGKALNPLEWALPRASVAAGKLQRSLDKVANLISNDSSFPDAIRLPIQVAIKKGPSAVTATTYSLAQQFPQFRELLERLRSFEEESKKETEELDLYKE